MVRIVTAGSVPPELGGKTIGGVASFHANLLRQYAPGNRFGVELTAVFAGNLGTKGPFHPKLANVGANQREEEQAFVRAARDADAVLIFHVQHRFAAYWERNVGMPPLVARVPSWTGLGPDVPEKIAVTRSRLDRARSVALVTRHLLEEGVRRGYVSRQNAHAVPSALDDRFLAPVVNLGQRSRRVVFVGALDENKGPLALLLALERMSDWSGVVVGGGPLADDVRTLCSRDSLRGRVELRGALSDRDALCGILDHASVLCVPSRREAFGSVYVEAIARGAFAVGSAACIAEINDTLGVKAGIELGSQDPGEIASSIWAAHRLETDRHHAAAQAQRHYSAERCAGALAQLLKS